MNSAATTPDGQFLYYLKDTNLPYGQHSQLWRMAVWGGEEKLVIERVFSRNFAVTKGGIYFMQGPEQGVAGGFMIRYLDVGSGQTRNLAALPPQIKPYYGFTVSPDEHTILYALQDVTGADLMLVDDVR